MAADVSKRASAEIPPTAPFERRIGGVIRPFGRRPSQRSHARVSGTDGASAGRVTPWGQYSLRRPFEGRSVQMWASRMGPRTPLQTISQRRRVPSEACPWLPIWLPVFLAREGRHLSRLRHGMRQRFFAVDVFAVFHGED